LDYIAILQEILKYIDDNIKEKMNVEKLAAKAGFSPYHFCRVFQWEIGYSIMEYVRNRRLFYAASELTSEKRINDIALDYGFETHSGFSKAFRRYFGCSPEKYSEHASFDVPKLPVLKKTKEFVNGGIIMEPKIQKRETFKIVGFNKNIKYKNNEHSIAIPKFWYDYIHDGRKERLHKETFIKTHTEYGACYSIKPECGEFLYVIGVEVKEEKDITKEYYTTTIPESLYAIFTTPPVNDSDSFDDFSFPNAIQGTWKYIFSEWFPCSGYEFDSRGVDFELYDERCNSEIGKVMDIYIPIIKKQL